MPRQARLDAPGVLQHVMARGIERRKIFWDDKDRSSFLERLAVILKYLWSGHSAVLGRRNNPLIPKTGKNTKINPKKPLILSKISHLTIQPF